MASTPLIPVEESINLTTQFQDIYIVPANKSRAGIDAVVFNNYTDEAVDITIRIVQSGDGDIFDEVVTERTIRKKDNYLAPGIIGQSLLTGGRLQVKVSANDSVNGKLTVTEIDAN